LGWISLFQIYPQPIPTLSYILYLIYRVLNRGSLQFSQFSKISQHFLNAYALLFILQKYPPTILLLSSLEHHFGGAFSFFSFSAHALLFLLQINLRSYQCKLK
jgi:hypothetical protein